LRQPAIPVIGVLGLETPEVFATRVRAFRQGLSEKGYAEGRNVSIQFQWAGGNSDLLRTMADELVRRHLMRRRATKPGRRPDIVCVEGPER
jgi:putative tryptophan/tyrosine transport system substrate-binding protein